MKENRNFDFKMDEAEMEISFPEISTPHPSDKFREFLKTANLTNEPANKLAKILGISRTAFYDFINAKNGISPEMSIRLARFFHDFDPVLYPNAASPNYWWDINTKWIFIYGIQNPKNGNKKNNVGIERYKLDKNNVISTVEDHNKLDIDGIISLKFRPAPPEN